LLIAKDVSYAQGFLGAAAFKGCVLVAIKCTELGPGVRIADPQYKHNRAMAKAAGAVVAPYHFAHPDVSAADSWDFYASNAELEPGDFPALDLEVTANLPPAEVASWGSAYAHTCYGAKGVWPLAYSDQSFILDGNFDGLRRCPWWVAILSDPGAMPPLVDGHGVLMQQYRIGGTGVPNSDALYLPGSADLASYVIPGRRKLIREADAEVGRLRRLLGLLK
jgi:GH25 family lysozyme M1 (1,4-beta-N-acetylmuramidase)